MLARVAFSKTGMEAIDFVHVVTSSDDGRIAVDLNREPFRKDLLERLSRPLVRKLYVILPPLYRKTPGVPFFVLMRPSCLEKLRWATLWCLRGNAAYSDGKGLDPPIGGILSNVHRTSLSENAHVH